jgi:putative endonuclease
MFYVYILQSQIDQSYYKGHTNDLADRLKRHNGLEEKYTLKLAPWILIWCCEKETKSMAYQLEKKLKNLSRERLQTFMKKYPGQELLDRFRP